MAEPNQIAFGFKEVVEMLVQKQGIHEGIWGIYVRFGMNAQNIGATENDLRPAVIIPILEIGLQKSDKETNLTVDAAKVNPRQNSAILPKKHR
jgi:hypothetical protein